MIDDPKFEGVDAIKEHVESWRDVSPSKMKFERLSGLSNEIWKVSIPDNIEPQTVIYRKFGEAGSIVDRDRENIIIKGLAKKKLSPMFYGGTKEYRIEKFQESKSLDPPDLKEKPIRRRLARLLADLHSLKFDKLDKIPAFWKILTEGSFIKDFEEKVERDVYTPIEKKFIKDIKTLISEEEISFLKEIAPKKEESVVFSHNDLHAGNVLQLAEDHSFILIDFEYSDYNYRGFDIANFFNEAIFEYDTAEHPHYTVDESKYPNDRELSDFCKYYLFFTKYGGEEYDLQSILKNDNYRDEYILQKQNMDSFNKEVKELLEEVKVCELFSHYFWSLWAVVKSHDSDIEFDYMHFAYKRFEIYQKLKRNLLKEEKNEKEQDSDTGAP